MYQSDLALFGAARQRTLDLVEGLTQVQIEFSPGPGQWSVGEVLDHLLLAEALNRRDIAELIDMAKNGRRPSLKRTFADVNVSMAYIPKGYAAISRSAISVVEHGRSALRTRIPDSLSTGAGAKPGRWDTTQRSIPRRTAPGAARFSARDGGSLCSELDARLPGHDSPTSADGRQQCAAIAAHCRTPRAEASVANRRYPQASRLSSGGLTSVCSERRCWRREYVEGNARNY